MSAPATSSNYKTVMCVYWETGCPRQSTCIFAHSWEELRPRMCPHGTRCLFDRRKPTFDPSRRPCGFFHPGEMVNTQALFQRATEFGKAKPVAMPGSVKVKTELCPYWDSGCRASECSRAHNKEELSPNMCHYGTRCRKRSECRCMHPGDKYTQDGLFEYARRKLEAKARFQAKVPQFVVNVTEEDSEEEVEVVPEKKTTFSLSALCAWDDDEDPDYSAPIVFAVNDVKPTTDADLTEVDMDLSE